MNKKNIIIVVTLLIIIIGLGYLIFRSLGNKPGETTSTDNQPKEKVQQALSVLLEYQKNEDIYTIKSHEVLDGSPDSCQEDLQEDFVEVEFLDKQQRIIYSCAKNTTVTISFGRADQLEAVEEAVGTAVNADEIEVLVPVNDMVDSIVVKDVTGKVIDRAQIN
ncbi:hypothetical protein A3A93_04830 [Candidatus Roizmanbacteria bacterium RIFCSPLOWO2_01_FULL_38_12]|uniref:Uncharacterized protein n=1 Tax=Candidatus Roizmanbacteria bacterium RIFCSPLOWO2_01_FULL_38_12 TaxID=1802061 RepID=A0A1F7IW22_9BACT|nr:MAG: hypothetical protein A3F59_06080 [Candidatus Roizmanbacteria bacterium RIFCSPHIGHO2_12_FULL_38_13]OGK47533.1 MAG: hypothetical protein A3A93_04830 [Candidatus Roizmanbacteria bacterium RIFCSPLOWO2_01_FULL_38_12]